MVRWQAAFVLGMVGLASAAACSSDSKGSSGVGGTTATGGKGSGGASGASGKAGGGGKSGGGSGGASGSSAGGSGNRGGSAGKASGGDAGDPGAGGMGESGSSATGGNAGRGGNAGTGGTSGMAGEAGEAGAGGEGMQGLMGYKVRFIGAAHSYAANTEDELVSLITSETGIVPDRIHTTSGALLLEDADLGGADIVIADALQRTYSVAEAAVLADWVDAGHGLVIMNGYTGNPLNASGFASSYQISFGGGLVNGAATGERITGADLLAHPITNGVSSLRFWGGHELTSGDDMATPFALVNSNPVGMARAWGDGRVAVWGDDWILLTAELDYLDMDNAYPSRVFWKNVLTWVARPK